MATFKICVIPKDQRVDGTWNVKIRVTHNRKIGFIGTQYYVTKKDLDKNLALNEKRNNKTKNLYVAIGQKIEEYRKSEAALGERINAYSTPQLMDYFKRRETDIIDFFKVYNMFMDNLIKDKRVGSLKNYKTTYNKLLLYTGVNALPITFVTSKFLEGFEAWLREHKEGKETFINGNTAINHKMGCIRAVFNAAKKQYNNDDTGDIRIKHYPFSKYEIPTPDETKNRNLEITQIQGIRDYKSKFSRDALARDVFMISFYLMGINTVDLYQCPPIDADGRITYIRSKVDGKGKLKRKVKAMISIQIPPEMNELMQVYQAKAKDRAFNFYERYKSYSEFNRGVNKGLKTLVKDSSIKLPKDLSSYYARHTWATIAANDCGIDEKLVDRCLNHIDNDMKMARIYIKKDWSQIDNANRQVIDLLNAKPEKKE